MLGKLKTSNGTSRPLFASHYVAAIKLTSIVNSDMTLNLLCSAREHH